MLLLACLALLTGSAHAAMAVRMDDAAALLREDGGEIVPQGIYSDIVPLGEDLFAATEDGALYALLDGSGAALTGAVYEELRLSGGVLAAWRDGGWGLLSRDGSELGDFAYSAILPNGAGGCWALRDVEELRAVYLLGADGAARDSGLRALRWGEPGEGLLPVMTEAGLWGCCDASGAMAIPARYEWLGSFTAGCAAAVQNGRYGAIDRSGSWIVDAEWDFLEISPEGLLLLAGPDGAQVCSTDGSAIATVPGEGVWIARAGRGYAVGDEASLRVYDASGSLIETLAPDASVAEGLDGQLVISEGMWGESCVRLSGTALTYQNLYPLGTAEGKPVYAALEVRSARYQSDLLNEVQVSVDMESARYGLVDGDGLPLPPEGYLSVRFLADDRFLVQSESQYRVINSWGKVYWRSNGATRTVEPRF